MLSRRLQILLDEARYERVAAEASSRGVSVAAVVREAIDRGLPADRSRRRAAIDAVLAADPMPVPADPADLRAELDESRAPSA